jgi:hypothetical protein
MAKYVGILLMVVVLGMTSMASAYGGRGYHRGKGYYGYGYRGHGYYGYKRPSVVIVPQVVVPFGVPYLYPPVVVAPPPVYVQPAPQVYVQPPPPQPYWYYCDNPKGYYPYVSQCPSGWRQVTPPPPG